MSYGLENVNEMKQAVDVSRVQDVLLNMAKCIASILESHSVPYMIAYGTLLGAVRHKGFIPWDDDFDFYLFDDKYELAIRYLRKELPETMFLEDELSEPLYFHGWAHVKDKGSVAISQLFPQDSLYVHKGISVDLYRTKRMKLSELETFLNDENKSYLERRKKKGLINAVEYNNRIEKLLINIRLAKEDHYTNDYDVYNLVPLYRCHSMKASSVFPLKRYRFEDFNFWGPNNADEILTNIYGNYMELPPIDKRKCHYSNVIFKDNNL